MRRIASILGSCLLLLATGALAGPTGANAETRRSVTVSGSGEIYAAPDRARLSMSVELTQPQLKDAQDQANRVMRDFLAQAHALGCKDEDISTAALSIRAEYNFINNNGSQTRQFAGYHVSRGIELVVRDLSRVGDYLKAATTAGVNELADPQLESSQAEDLRRQALAKAAVDARARAQAIASSLGVKLGSVHTIEASPDEGSPRPPRPLMAMARSADTGGGNEEMGFAAGQIRFSANLTADFDLVAP